VNQSHVVRIISSAFLLTLALSAQDRRDVIPLKPWSAPLSWQPSSSERSLSPKLANQPISSPSAFVAMTPCRVADTRATQNFPSPFGTPSLVGGAIRSFPMQASTLCTIPSGAIAYSLNVTVATVNGVGLGYLTLWPVGSAFPTSSTLNNVSALPYVANAAIVPAGNDSSGSIDAFASNTTDLIIDINGYYTQASSGGASLPVGTVVWSMLDATTFSSQQNPGETWILADGRSIAGLNLAYETLTMSSTIPNILGVFIRGKNNGRSDGNQNPDGDLALGTFTADRFASHDHGGGAHTHNTSTQNGAAVDFGGLIVRIPGAGTFNSATDSSGTIINADGGAETSPKDVTMNPFIRVN
jgi:hypothetical protein